ncbi:MAG: GmrSD restriction endonuclease domain-containing protein [Caldisericum exile]|uniref:GmrSD restriction endonuclease domain-containing protein n=1 Tax=Caldisericum exile TaxID=693075 RepID=UPI003C73928E
MIIQKFSVNNHPIQTLLSWVSSNEIAVPEIQRPFVWDAIHVRDLIDSLYRGYPIGYLITWQNPNVKLRDGTMSKGKKILIDGQQRVTALMAALLGKEILNKDYKKHRIIIAFNPVEQKFEVSNPFIQRDKRWIPDISVVFSPEFRTLEKLKEYCNINPDVKEDDILNALDSLKSIINIPIGLIELNSELDINEVTEIFIRINSSGVILSQADFAMSKIAVDEKYGGNTLRKAIDYFCYLATTPEFYNQIKENDKEFTNTEYFNKMAWLKDDRDDLFDPSYTDVLRISFTYKFKRGRLEDLVSLLSGRDFETRQYKEEIVEGSFSMLKEGIMDFMNENNFKKFSMIIRSAGFIDSSMIRSQTALDFAYTLYLFLKAKGINQSVIESYVRKWFVLSILTSRYSSSPETTFDYDIKRIDSDPFNYMDNVLLAELSDSFFEISLPQQLDTSVGSSPFFNVFLAAQVKFNDKGFLSKDITVKDLIAIKGDVHHIYPRNYLKKLGYNRGMYNQIANYVMAQSEINIAIGDKEPKKYFAELREQCNSKELKYGGITDFEMLKENLKMNCIPLELLDTEMSYEDFLKGRRKLMSNKIKEYFKTL